MESINEFRGKYKVFSNFYESPVEYEGITYRNSEAAFQSAKIHIPNNMEYTNLLRVKEGFSLMSPLEAKRKGRRIKLRTDWEVVKDEVMYNILLNKFSRDKNLLKILLETGEKELIEGNTWHDNYWGNCNCIKCKNIQGKNKLGKLLMMVRKELSK